MIRTYRILLRLEGEELPTLDQIAAALAHSTAGEALAEALPTDAEEGLAVSLELEELTTEAILERDA